MAHPINIPKLGLTMEEGTVVEWFYNDGDEVKKGAPLYSVETDKIVSDVEADNDGFLQRVVPIDTTLPVAALVGYLHPNADAARAAAGSGAAPSASVAAPAKPAAAAAPVAPAPAAAPAPATRPAAVERVAPAVRAAPAAPASAPPVATGGRIQSSPLARTKAAERGVDLRFLTGTGPGGAILMRDVDAAAAAAPVQPAVPGRAAAAGSTPSTRRPMSSLRRAIAQRMSQSLASSAQMTGFGTVDMTEVARWREAMLAEEERLGARITFTDFCLKAAATVLEQMPEINSYIDGNEIVTWNEINIGLAVAIDDGLIVPVIRNVDRLGLAELSNARKALIEKARAGQLARDDIEGATFTLSNFGSYGGDIETPILNPPQSALLGIGEITEQPVVRNGEIVIRKMMGISLTFDHRLIDGAVAGAFRKRFKGLLEETALWMATMR
jgi:pyruvate/2-oxoglutarate dehydrogenase complex dihydrolipoamide acyltransferase (E2) component